MRPLALAALAYAAASLLAAAVWAVVAPALARDEDAEPTCPNLHWDDETCPGCDCGPDDLEAVARVTGLVVWPAVHDVEALADEIVWGAL